MYLCFCVVWPEKGAPLSRVRYPWSSVREFVQATAAAPRRKSCALVQAISCLFCVCLLACPKKTQVCYTVLHTVLLRVSGVVIRAQVESCFFCPLSANSIPPGSDSRKEEGPYSRWAASVNADPYHRAYSERASLDFWSNVSWWAWLRTEF